MIDNDFVFAFVYSKIIPPQGTEKDPKGD